MGKLKDAHVFSNGKGAIAKYFVALAGFAAAQLAAQILTSLTFKEPVHWGESILVLSVILAAVTVVYFLTRFLAYRTKIFPKTENREGVHGVSFIFLMILSIILLVVFI